MPGRSGAARLICEKTSQLSPSATVTAARPDLVRASRFTFSRSFALTGMKCETRSSDMSIESVWSGTSSTR